MSRARRVLLTVVLVALGGCASQEDPALEPPEPSAEPAATSDGAEKSPTFTITSPPNNAMVEADFVKVTIAVENFEVVDKIGEDPVDGEGHVHFYKDVEEMPTTPGKPAVTEDESTYHAAATTSHTWEDLGPGEHTLGVQLVNNDHTPLEPPVTAEVTVKI